MEVFEAAIRLLRLLALGSGAVIIFSGIVRGAFEARGETGRARFARETLAGLELGLDLFVAATLLNLVISQTWVVLASVALTIVTRKLITTSLGRATVGNT